MSLVGRIKKPNGLYTPTGSSLPMSGLDPPLWDRLQQANMWIKQVKRMDVCMDGMELKAAEQ